MERCAPLVWDCNGEVCCPNVGSSMSGSVLFVCADQRIILSKCPQLIQEMVSVLCQLWFMQQTRQGAGKKGGGGGGGG